MRSRKISAAQQTLAIGRPPAIRRGHRCDRRGASTIEFALIIPVLLVLTFGTIDVCTAFFLKESAVLAAYEGARQGVGRNQTNADVQQRVEEFLTERNIRFDGSVVTISSPGFDNAGTLDEVTVTVEIPTEGNLLVPSELLAGLNITGSVTMLKEYANLDEDE